MFLKTQPYSKLMSVRPNIGLLLTYITLDKNVKTSSKPSKNIKIKKRALFDFVDVIF